jgi:DNA-binding response OmpR family regulator
MNAIHLLVVDDATYIRDFIRSGIKNTLPDAIIDEAVNGKEAQSLIEANAYHLILCDWEMPEMSGAEVLAWLRGHATRSRTPFIMVTSRGDREHVVHAVKSGADSYVIKPFTIEGLFAKMAMVLKKGGATTGAAQPADQAAAKEGHSGDEHDVGDSAPGRTVTLRYGDTVSSAEILDLKESGGELALVRGVAVPPLLDPVVVDVPASSHSSEISLNAFIHRMRANQPSREADRILLSLLFTDQDPLKSEQLQRFIQQLQG